MSETKSNRKTRVTELWHVGVAHAPVASFLQEGAAPDITWLPLPRPFCFIADPFALRGEDGVLNILVETLDYRTKRGEIGYYRMNDAGEVIEQGTALKAATHLSYPYLIRHEGGIYMLPESSRSGRLTLYRATDFPRVWEPAATLLDLPAIDASPIYAGGRWWMFFALPGSGTRALDELHIAYADSLFGPWHMHAANPVRKDIASSRMGGTPFLHDGTLYLPVQDCSRTYGGALCLLRVDDLTPERFAATPQRSIGPHWLGHAYRDGCHTLSACGEVTLLDVKRHDPSRARILIDWQRKARRLLGLR